MVKIAFHDNQLCERGTTVSLFDYAYYNKYYLKNESIIMYYGSDHRNDNNVIAKFSKEFKLCPYENWNNDANRILENEKCDILYMQKAGEYDGKMADPNVCRTVIHCVFNTQQQHGHIYAKISPFFGSNQVPVINYMVNLPNIDTNMRDEVGIPDDALVFGRIGGRDQFNIPIVHQAIDRITNENPNIYFFLVNTDKFCSERKNIIHYGKIINLNKKVEFINSCDAMIHARQMGETFGAAVAEFSIKNKPIITCKGFDNAHLNILRDKVILYDRDNFDSVYNIFGKMKKSDIEGKDWNAYGDYSPEKVMDIFKKVFIDPFKF
mgnify:CR=1 FL=1|jgi:hypothetical protein